MNQIVLLMPDFLAGVFEAAFSVALVIFLLALRHLLSGKRVAVLLGSGTNIQGPFRWPLCGSPRMVASHRLLATALIGVPAGGSMLILFGPHAIIELTLSGSGLGAAFGIGALSGAALVSVMAVLSRQGDLSARYPAMRPVRWTAGIMVLNAGTWAVYLVAYEYLLRGVLLGVLWIVFGPLPALVVTALVDAIAHIPQGWPETLGAIFSASLFALMAFVTGGIIASFIAHLAMAVSVDVFCVRFESRAPVSRPDH